MHCFVIISVSFSEFVSSIHFKILTKFKRESDLASSLFKLQQHLELGQTKARYQKFDLGSLHRGQGPIPSHHLPPPGHTLATSCS